MARTTKNQIIHDAQEKFDLYGWQIAEIIGVSDTTWIRWQRKEMSEEKQREIVKAIEEAMKKV